MAKLKIALRTFQDFEAALSAQILAHHQTNPEIEVEVLPFDLVDLHRRLFEEHGLASGDLDLAIFPTDWIGYAISSGALENLASWMSRRPLPDWPDGWPASLREPLRSDGDFYCIPWHDGPESLLYRKDLFEAEVEKQAFTAKYERPLAPPRTWLEFTEVCRFFTRPESRLYGTLFAAYPDGHNTLYDLALQVWSRGGELYLEDGSSALDNPIVAEALDFYRKIIRDRSMCYPGCENIDSIASGDVFLTGQIAMMVNWFGFAARCNQEGSPLKGKIGLAPIPGGRPGQSASLSNYWVIGIGSGSRNKRESYELLRHIARPEMDKLTALSGAVGVRLSTWRDPDVLQRVPFYSHLEGLCANARTLPFHDQLPKFAEIVNQIVNRALRTTDSTMDILRDAQRMAEAQQIRLNQELPEGESETACRTSS